MLHYVCRINSMFTEKVILKPHKNGVEIYYYETAAGLAAASMLGDQQKR